MLIHIYILELPILAFHITAKHVSVASNAADKYPLGYAASVMIHV